MWSQRTLQDRQQLADLLRTIDHEIFQQMTKIFVGISKVKMTEITHDMCAKHKSLEAPNRLCLRQRPAFICWFLTNWPYVDDDMRQKLKPTLEPTKPKTTIFSQQFETDTFSDGLMELDDFE
jgi:hypothetical protein